MKIKRKKTVIKKEYTPHSDLDFIILVCGSRDWTEENPIDRELNRAIVERGVQYKNVLVVTGSAAEDDNGVDSIVEKLCRTRLGIACAIFRAPWDFFQKTGNKRAAGPVRNGWMLRWGRPHLILAFHPYLPNSRGTKNLCEQARRLNIPVRVFAK